MSQVKVDAQGPGALSPKAARGPAERPLSPHVQVWRWHITMAASILNRATGSALYGGALLLAGWAVALAAGESVYAQYMALLTSPLGLVVLFGLTFSFFYHLAAGIRHLVWDSGEGFLPKTADMTAIAAITFAVVATVAIFAIGLLGAT